VPPYPAQTTRHLAAPIGAGELAAPDAVGEAGSSGCGDVVWIQLRIERETIREARFLAFGCGAATAAASAACERLTGAPLREAALLSADTLDRDLGGLGPDRRHGPELVADAVARALERWYSDRLGSHGLPLDRGRVAVAMSGGVDSAVAAMLLRDAGFDVVGVTMRLWHDPSTAAAERSCCSPETVQLARRTAHGLGIPHVTIDAAEAFRRGVVEDFIRGYRAGRTPNPCVTCNGEVRFRILSEVAALLGARRLATGHYARVDRDVIARADHRDKDQSYMLAMLDARTIRRLVFPLGRLTKAQVRELGRHAALPAADAVESQEVCFVGVGGYVPFLERVAGMGRSAGRILDENGAPVGTHEGYWRYTVGQRRGIGLAADGPRYVLRTDAATNTVVIGPRERLATRKLQLLPFKLKEPVEGAHLDVRVRYRGRALRGTASPTATGLRVTLEDPADGVAPGQTAALYRDGRLVGAGVIVEGNL
jgi:tRNA-specific 2-thiouridylase